MLLLLCYNDVSIYICINYYNSNSKFSSKCGFSVWYQRCNRSIRRPSPRADGGCVVGVGQWCATARASSGVPSSSSVRSVGGNDDDGCCINSNNNDCGMMVVVVESVSVLVVFGCVWSVPTCVVVVVLERASW